MTIPAPRRPCDPGVPPALSSQSPTSDPQESPDPSARRACGRGAASGPGVLYQSAVNAIHRADAREVAATLEPGTFSLAVLDGPYGMRKAEAWDCMKVSDLPTWYAPHLDDVDRLCALSASLYVWNSAEGWAELHAGIEARGWVFGRLLVWDKGVGSVTRYHARPDSWNRWPEATEVCGFYQREAWAPNTCAGQEIAYAAGADERNWIRLWLCEEWAAAGLRRPDADTACEVSCMASRHYFPPDQWWLPTWEHYQNLATYAGTHGPPRERPYLVHESVWPSGDLRASYDHLRAEYEASRPAFTCPRGVSNVWTHTQVTGNERLNGDDGETLHPCQKPIAFAERIIRASTRPGELVWVPFGGTCREAVAAEWMARSEPSEARKVVTCEIDQDGRDYLGAVVRQLEGKDLRKRNPAQMGLL